MKMIMIKKFCNKVNCNKLIDFNKSFCDKHLKKETNEIEKRFNKETKKVYNNSTWRSVRLSVLRRDDYTCLYCMANGLYSKATCVDHYLAIVTQEGYEDRYNIDGLISSCASCNTLKYYDEVKLREGRITFDEYKEKWKYTIIE